MQTQFQSVDPQKNRLLATHTPPNDKETFESKGSKRPRRKLFGIAEHKVNIKLHFFCHSAKLCTVYSYEEKNVCLKIFFIVAFMTRVPVV
jgi:hypothetical protein